MPRAGSTWFYSHPSGGWWHLSDNTYGKGQKQGERVRKSERNSPASAELGGEEVPSTCSIVAFHINCLQRN